MLEKIQVFLRYLYQVNNVLNAYYRTRTIWQDKRIFILSLPFKIPSPPNFFHFPFYFH